MLGLLAATAFGPVDQSYLLEARQMQALSFAVHIPLVCFGVAFPALVVFAEWLHLRTGNPVYLTLAKRWSKVMIALFAVGVVTGTILSFELGLLWPNFMATFGSVFGLAFGLEGFSFFLEAIFIAIYVYGWDRLSPRRHLLTGIPVIITGIAGSLFVIAVNAWMNNPSGFRVEGGKAVDVHPWSALFGNHFLWHEIVHMYVAPTSSSASSSRVHTRSPGCGATAASTCARRWRCRSRSRRWRRRFSSSSATGRRARSPTTSRSSWPPSRGWRRRPRARPSTSSAGTATGR